MTANGTSIRLASGAGIGADILPYGATVQALRVPDRDGRLADVVLGHDSVEGYRARRSFLGATIGRVANRIAGGRFTFEGETYRLATNNGPNALHGGLKGFDTVTWSVLEQSGHAVSLGHTSPHDDEGYPGTLNVRTTYSLEDGALVIDYAAETDRPTLVNLTNHSFFNLGGAESEHGILDHVLTLAAEHYLPVDATAIPLGDEAAVAGTPFDFRQPTVLRDRVLDTANPQIAIGGGIDHTFCLGTDPALRRVARLEDPRSGRVMEVLTDAPGVQVYSGNFLDGSITGKAGKTYPRHHALCLECQDYPDAPNRPDFPSIRLAPGAVYRRKTVYRFSSVEIRRNDP
jgi:aldose 1-epimerase